MDAPDTVSLDGGKKKISSLKTREKRRPYRPWGIWSMKKKISFDSWVLQETSIYLLGSF